MQDHASEVPGSLHVVHRESRHLTLAWDSDLETT